LKNVKIPLFNCLRRVKKKSVQVEIPAGIVRKIIGSKKYKKERDGK